MRDKRTGVYRKTHRFCNFGLGLLFAVLALVALCVSFFTKHWVHYDVNRNALESMSPPPDGFTVDQYQALVSNDLRFYSRSRGLFETCFRGNETWVFPEKYYDYDDVSGACVRQIGYEFDEDEWKTLNYEEDNLQLRKYLMIAQLAAMVAAFAWLTLSILITTVIGCWCRNVHAFIVSFVICFLGAIKLLLGIIFFHWYKYLEENNMDYDQYGRKAWAQLPYLEKNTNVKYHVSYGLAWVAFTFTVLAFIMFGLSAWSTRRKKLLEKAGIKKGDKPVKQPPKQPLPPQQPVYVQPPPPLYVPVPVPVYSTLPAPSHFPEPEPDFYGSAVYQSALPPGFQH